MASTSEYACPECGKKFKQEKGVSLHLSNPRSSCKGWLETQLLASSADSEDELREDEGAAEQRAGGFGDSDEWNDFPDHYVSPHRSSCSHLRYLNSSSLHTGLWRTFGTSSLPSCQSIFR